ncbi:hypothetical protein ASF20_07545 [Methylobacterium sp. Leaf88]|nr:hypothetical protein ASF20_07545 [Methylobacterium sp. Leaf88]
MQLPSVGLRAMTRTAGRSFRADSKPSRLSSDQRNAYRITVPGDRRLARDHGRRPALIRVRQAFRDLGAQDRVGDVVRDVVDRERTPVAFAQADEFVIGHEDRLRAPVLADHDRVTDRLVLIESCALGEVGGIRIDQFEQVHADPSLDNKRRQIRIIRILRIIRIESW